MIEYAVVDHPVFFPQMCSCGSQKGPLIDTHRERAGLHEYVCYRCVQNYARLMGLAKADVLETAANAKRIEADLTLTVEGLRQQLQVEGEEKEIALHALEEAEKEIGRLNGRISQLEDRIHSVAEELVA